MALKVYDKCCWKDISANKIFTNKLNRFSLFLQEDACSSYLPFFLFADSLPSKERLEEVLHDWYANNQLPEQYVLITQKNGTNELNAYWKEQARGLYDVLEWAGEEDLIDYAQSLGERNKRVMDVMNTPLVKKNLVGESRVWKTFLQNIIEAALFSQVSVLLIGESGTGKELLSRLIHTLDTRKNKNDLVLVDCTTIVPELSGSEFFGHEKGSYTNAIQSREGAFALANEGTLFLDEVGEMPMPLQAELLRVIQEGTYKKVGSNTWRQTQFRLICATNKDLQALVQAHKFRQDLYFRMADFEFRVPSLHERLEDIPLLAKHFLQEFFPNDDCPEFDASVLDYLMNRSYTGNVRELRQLIRRIALKHVRHKKITMGEIPVQDRFSCQQAPAQAGTDSFREALQRAILSGCNLWELKNRTMEGAIQIALELSDGNKELAAKKLGVTWRAILQFWKKNKNEMP